MSVADTSFRVAFCFYDTPGGHVGGPIAWALDILRYVKAAGVELVAIVLRDGGDGLGRIANRCETLGIPVKYLDTSSGSYLEDQIEWILEQCRVDKVHTLVANLVLPAWFAARHLKKAGVKTIGVLHSDPTFDPFYRDLVDHFVSDNYACPSVVVSVSEFIGRIAADKSSKAAFSGVVIPCGCQMPSRIASPPADELKLVYAGRLVTEQKRIKETAKALLKVCQTAGITATVYGDGPEKEAVELLLCGQSSVQYLGQLAPADMPAALSCHHVIVLLSDYEGLPMALLEAMACGLVPICLSGTSGVVEVIEDGINGFLVVDRETAFYTAIERIRDPKVWAALSEAAKQTVRARYCHEIVFPKWLELISHRTEGVIRHCQIPRSIGRVSRAGRFAGYPESRPSVADKLSRIANRWFIATRMVLRPRARFRELLRFLQGAADN